MNFKSFCMKGIGRSMVAKWLLAMVFVVGGSWLSMASMSGQKLTNAEKLGFPKGKKVILLHNDDAGMCVEANDATKFYIEKGYVTSAAVMMPCPAAREMVEWAKQHPNADIGVHLTLTSEWKTYRWSTMVDKALVPGLIDGQGMMWPDVRSVVMNASPAEVEKEIRAQIESMLALGYKPTHIDTHMGTLYGSAEFVKVFLKIAEEYRLPANAIDISDPKIAQQFRAQGYPITAEVVEIMNQYTLPKLDNFGSVPKGSTYQEVRDNFFAYVNSLESGLTEIIFHASVPTENMKTITGSWQQRGWEAELFADPVVHKFFADNDIILTNWREIMERFEARN